jgi:hypothetical protein
MKNSARLATTTSSRRALIAAMLFALSACSGGAGSDNVVPRGAPQAATAHKVAGSITIRIPKHRASRHRRSKYISPSTESIQVTANPAPSCTGCSPEFTIAGDLLPQSFGCTVQDVCKLPFAALPGTYAFTVATYDGLVDANRNPTGSVLSQNQGVVFTIVAGKQNALNLTLSGVPVFLNVGLAGGSSPHALMSYSHTPRMIGLSSSASFTFAPLDEDGNVIVGPGTPAFAVSGGSPFKVTQTGAQTFSIAAPAAYTTARGILTFTSHDPGCLAANAKCNQQIPVTFDQLLATTSGANGLSLWPVDAPASAAIAPTQVNININVAPAFDSKWDVFVEESDDTHLAEYKPPYTSAPTLIPIAQANMILVDAQDDLVLPEVNSSQVVVLAPPYTGTPQFVSTGIVAPTVAAIDGSGNLWIVNNQVGGVQNLVRYAAPYVGGSPDVTIGTGILDAIALAFDTSGHVYALNANNSGMGAFDITQYPAVDGAAPSQTYVGTASASLKFATGMVFSPASGTLLVDSSGDQVLNQYSPTSATAVASSPLANQAPQGMALDDDGVDWIADTLLQGSVTGYLDPYTNFDAVASGFAPNSTLLAVSPLH